MLSRLMLLLLTAFCLSPIASIAETTMSASMSTTGVDSTLTFSGTIQGRQYKDYPFKAGAGQRIDISYRSDHPGSYFNVLPPRSGSPWFVGSRMGNRFGAVLPETGEYLIRVYLSGHAAERNESAQYQLQVRVSESHGVPLTFDPRLSGTTWQLLSFQSMDDAHGMTRISDGSRYQMTLAEHGRAFFRLDCNRGMGSWQIKTASPDSGSIQFGPLGVTRMLCPSPSMGEKLARDMEFVRGYRLIGDRLYLSLMADGGIYEWQRSPAKP